MFTLPQYKQIFSPIILERGRSYYLRNKIKSAWYEFGCAYFRITGSETYHVRIEIDEDGNVYDYYCDCPCEFECKHLAAAFMYLENQGIYNRETKSMMEFKTHKRTVDPEEKRKDDFFLMHNGDIVATRQLVSIYGNQISVQSNMIEPPNPVKLFPIFEEGHDGLYVSFRIGATRSYVLRDLVTFVNDINNQRTVTYGKELTFTHTISSFENKELVKWICRNLSLAASSRYNYTNIRMIALNAILLEELLQLLQPREITYKKLNGEQVIYEVLKENPILYVHCNDEKYGYVAGIDGLEACFEAESSALVIYEGKAYICEAEWKNSCFNLVKMLSERAMCFDASLLPDISTKIVRKTDKYIQFDSIFSTYMPDNGVVEFFLDYDNNFGVTLHFVLTYKQTEITFATFNEKFDEIKRDSVLENQLIECLKSIFPYEIKEEYRLCTGEIDESELPEFLENTIPKLEKIGLVYVSSELKAYQNPRKFTMNVGVRIENDLVNLQFISELPIDEMADILKQYRLHKKYYRMRNGDIVHLEGEEIDEFNELLLENHIDLKQLESNETNIELYRALALQDEMKTSQMLIERDNSLHNMLMNLQNFDIDDICIPETMSNILRDYQKSGYRWLKTMSQYGFGGVLADDMGIGKTIQVIALFEDLRLNKQNAVSLVVCPTSLVLNWQSEINRFAPELRVGLIEGFSAKRNDVIEHYREYDVLVTSYDYIRRDYEAYADIEFKYIILDEAQFIKNQTTKSAQAVKKIKGKHRFALTGTPIENSLAELWSIFDFLMPSYLYSYTYFKDHYETDIVKNKDEYVLSKLKRLVEPFMLRRTKQEVLKELPSKIDSVLFVEMDEESRKIYDSNLALMNKELRKELEKKGVNQSKFAVLAMLTRLRQICCSPKLVIDGYSGDSAKLMTCLEYVETCIDNGKKVLLFSQFTSMLELVEEQFNKARISYFKLTGATPKSERARMVEQFNHDDTKVFLISLKAGGTGLNLTSAEVVIHLDPWWNVSAQNQATDRAYRIGQTKNVQVVRMIAKDSVEEKIMKLQEQKKELADAIISENEGIITSMDKEELFDLFR